MEQMKIFDLEQMLNQTFKVLHVGTIIIQNKEVTFMNASVQKAIQRYSSDSIGKIVMGSETSIFDGGSAIGFSYDNKE